MAGRDEGTGALIEPRNNQKSASWPCRHGHPQLTVVHPMVGETEQASHTEFRTLPDSNARRVIARVEAGPQGNDTRFIITNLAGTPEHLYEDIYCARGQAENLIKAHKLHLASDRTSCSKATANQF